MTAMQGAQRGESEADAALLPQGAGQHAGRRRRARADEIEGCEIGEQKVLTCAAVVSCC
jgi:hypothetical protein